MLDLPFSHAPFSHVMAMDIESKFKEVVEANLKGTRFVQGDVRKKSVDEIKKLLTKGRKKVKKNLHINCCFCCKDASSASFTSVDYADLERQVRHVTDIMNGLGRLYNVTSFGEFIVHENFLRIFRRYNPTASIVVMKKAGHEKRLRVYMATGFSLNNLEHDCEAKVRYGQYTLKGKFRYAGPRRRGPGGLGPRRGPHEVEHGQPGAVA